MRLPAEIPFPDVGFQLTLPTVQEFQDIQVHLERCIQNRDLDAAYLTWSAFWEGVLVRSVNVTKPEQAYLGRGKEPEPVMLYPKSPKKLVTTEREAFLLSRSRQRLWGKFPRFGLCDFKLLAICGSRFGALNA